MIKSENNETNKFYTVDQIAEILQVHWQTILGYIKSGDLGAVKLGRGYRISDKDLSDFIEKRRARK